MRHRSRLIIVTITAAATLTACRGAADLSMVVRPDGSGEVSIATAVDRATAARLADEGDPFDVTGVAASAPRGARIQPWRSDGLEGTRWITPFESPAELESFFATPGAPEMVEVERSAENVSVAVDLPALTEAMMGDVLGDAVSTPEGLGSHLALTFTLELPGRLVDHNADRVAGGVLVWDLVDHPRPAWARSRLVADRPRFAWAAWGGALLAVTAFTLRRLPSRRSPAPRSGRPPSSSRSPGMSSGS